MTGRPEVDQEWTRKSLAAFTLAWTLSRRCLSAPQEQEAGMDDAPEHTVFKASVGIRETLQVV